MKILLLILGLFYFMPLMAQDFELIPFRENELWGFADSNTNIKIQPKYEEVLPFNHGFSAFKLNGKWGVMNLEGVELTEPIFDSTAGYFGSYLAADDNFITRLYVHKDGDQYLVDSMGTRELGNMVIELDEQEENYHAQFHRILRENGMVGIHFIKLDMKIEPQYDSIVFVKSYNYGEDDYIFAKKGSLWAKVSITNKPLTEFEYQALQLSRENFTEVLFKQDNKWGVLNKIDEVLLKNSYDSIIPKYNEYLVLKDNNWGVLDHHFNIIIPLEYTHIEYNIDGYKVKNEKNKIGFIGKDGELIIPLKYMFLEQFSGWENRNLFKYSSTYNSKLIGCFNLHSNLFIPEEYKEIKAYDNGYFLVKTKNGKIGFINSNNEKFFKN